MSARSGWHELNLVLAVLVHVVLGLFWIASLWFTIEFPLGSTLAWIWALSALALGPDALRSMVRSAMRPGHVWWLTFRWWLLSWVAPVGLAFAARTWLRPPSPERVSERRATVNVDLEGRIASIEWRLQALQQDLETVKRLAAAQREPTPPPAEPVPPPATEQWWEAREPARATPAPEPKPVARPLPAPEPTPKPVTTPVPVAATTRAEPEPPEPGFWGREVDWADFLGARALAIAGGLVTVLGIVFFFALAVNRGWIGPELRVTLGALASALVFGGGFELRRRYGDTYAALAAVGAGIAGGYATLLFATARYDLVPDLAALVLAGAIGSIGLATALVWSAELVAGFGLVGAMLVPFTVVLSDEISAIGTGFVAIVLAAAGIVGLRRGWDWLLVSSAVASLPQAAILVADAGRGDAAALTLTVVFGVLYAGIGVARLLESDDAEPSSVGVGFLVAGAGFVALSFQHLLDGSARGVAILLAAGAAGALSVFFLRSRPTLSALLGTLVAASLPQAALLVANADRGDASIIAVTTAFAVLFAAIGIARHLVRGPAGLDAFGASFVTGAAGFAAVSSLHLLDGTARGIALLVLAGAYGVLATAFFRSRRDLSSLLWAASLILAAGAGGELLSGLGLATVWAAQGAVLSWLAWQTRESRFQLGSLGYLGLAVGHALLYDAPPRDLFTATLHAAAGAPALIAIAAGLVALAAFARHEEESSVLALAGLRQIDLRRAALIAAAVASTGAASLGVLDLFQRESTFPWGEVAVTALWSAVALAALVAGLRRDSALVTLCGFAAYLAPIVKTLTSDASLGEPERWYALLAVGTAAIAGGFAYQLLERRLQTLHVVGVALHGAGLALGATAVVELLGPDQVGTALLVVAAVYGTLSAAIFGLERQRDHATLLWSVALGFAAVAAPVLLDGTSVVLAWAAPAAALALLARRLREPRFLIPSAGLLTVALAETLARLAPPSELTSASMHPGDGVPALVLSLAAGLVVLWVGRSPIEAGDHAPRSDSYRELAHSLEGLVETTRIQALWASGLLGLYTVSLGLLELFEQVTPGTIEERFQHGHTAVSACWALVALGLLYAGLVRRTRALRLGGFALFGAALGKLFLYDLATLSSITRALSFLAVGALLLIAGFFYQRVTQELGLRDETPQLSG